MKLLLCFLCTHSFLVILSFFSIQIAHWRWTTTRMYLWIVQTICNKHFISFHLIVSIKDKTKIATEYRIALLVFRIQSIKLRYNVTQDYSFITFMRSCICNINFDLYIYAYCIIYTFCGKWMIEIFCFAHHWMVFLFII